MVVFETERLLIRKLNIDDADFMLDLLNQPSFHHFIGDRGVRTTEDARTYIRDRAISIYEKAGLGPFAVELKSNGDVIGVSSLLKRDELDDVDVGFAFLPDYWKQGFATESGNAALEFAFSELGLDRIVAVTQSDNVGSIKTLENMGMVFEKMVRLEDEGPDLQLFSIERSSGS